VGRHESFLPKRPDDLETVIGTQLLDRGRYVNGYSQYLGSVEYYGGGLKEKSSC